jgi:hypothetical protein
MNITTHTPTQLTHEDSTFGYDPKLDVCRTDGSDNQCSTAATVVTRVGGEAKTNPGCSTADAGDLKQGHAWCYCDKYDKEKEQHRWRFCSPDEVALKNNGCECSISAKTTGGKTNPACSSLEKDLYNGHPWCYCEKTDSKPNWKHCNEAEINKAVTTR